MFLLNFDTWTSSKKKFLLSSAKSEIGNLIVTIYLGQFERCVGIVPQSIKTVVDREPDRVVLKDALPVQRL